jgi:hypothetical protein
MPAVCGQFEKADLRASGACGKRGLGPVRMVVRLTQRDPEQNQGRLQ